MNRRTALASSIASAVASILPARIVSAASAAPTPGPLPPFPTPDLEPDEVIRRLVLWLGGPREAVITLVSAITGDMEFYNQAEATEEQLYHVAALASDLEESVIKTWRGNPDHDAAFAEACERHGYDHREPHWMRGLRREEEERARKLAAPAPVA